MIYHILYLKTQLSHSILTQAILLFRKYHKKTRGEFYAMSIEDR